MNECGCVHADMCAYVRGCVKTKVLDVSVAHADVCMCASHAGAFVCVSSVYVCVAQTTTRSTSTRGEYTCSTFTKDKALSY